MTDADLLDMAVGFAFGWFALGFLMIFAWGILLGFVRWMRSFLG